MKKTSDSGSKMLGNLGDAVLVEFARMISEEFEDALIDNKAVAYKNLTECKDAGIKIALDDFGAGHSSINDLGDYPVDFIKIDRQIIVKSVSDRGDALLKGIIRLAHSLGIAVVCEGIETKEQNTVAVKNACEMIQGYYYSYVYSVDEAEKYYIEKNKILNRFERNGSNGIMGK